MFKWQCQTSYLKYVVPRHFFAATVAPTHLASNSMANSRDWNLCLGVELSLGRLVWTRFERRKGEWILQMGNDLICCWPDPAQRPDGTRPVLGLLGAWLWSLESPITITYFCLLLPPTACVSHGSPRTSLDTRGGRWGSGLARQQDLESSLMKLNRLPGDPTRFCFF